MEYFFTHSKTSAKRTKRLLVKIWKNIPSTDIKRNDEITSSSVEMHLYSNNLNLGNGDGKYSKKSKFISHFTILLYFILVESFSYLFLVKVKIFIHTYFTLSYFILFLSLYLFPFLLV